MLQARFSVLGGAMIAILALLLFGSPNSVGAQALDQDSIVLPEMTPRLNMGRLSYEHFCASCHGLNTAGTDKGPTFLHRVYHPGHHGDGAFYIAPKQGVRAHHWPFGDMPPVEGITDDHIQAIVEYVRALQKANGVF